ncbi:hypothetical protein ACSMDK_23845 [Yersinia enterocolitica]|uniref:hypothetical protein n=1 Tax=Yersinia TaxID=629 RepID=UPI003303DACF|nr:hypothetical protein [Yersinia enterocolitica]HDL6983583.1 hypothetical protein [Yersinia enterocolitica]HDL7066700.1 hypothetical protein [Yersinia enterocolitica]HDL7071086.1 hypothetical protein [Yersinia enterocolitica]HDL7467080.1 hypothetical protein [Yersinia enterocolitica]
MFYFLQKRAKKRAVKTADKIITELESVYLDLDFFNKDDINLIELMQWTDTKLDEMAAVLEPNEEFIIEHHPELITRANVVTHIALVCSIAAMKEFQDELAGLGNILA